MNIYVNGDIFNNMPVRMSAAQLVQAYQENAMVDIDPHFRIEEVSTPGNPGRCWYNQDLIELEEGMSLLCLYGGCP